MILKAAAILILANIVWWLLVKNRDSKGDDEYGRKRT